VSCIQPAEAGGQPELEAVSEVLRGNKEAFRLIVERYKNLLYRLCFSYLGNREDAEECTQDILLRAFRYLRRFSLDKRFLPWLYAIAMNQLRLVYARNRRREAQQRAWECSAEEGPANDPQETLERVQSRESVRCAVASLPRTLREPMMLHYFEELGVTTIAEILGISEVSAKSRLLRGRRELRRKLEESATSPHGRGYIEYGGRLRDGRGDMQPHR
jgi:RNA polymerase sigma-70 factor (ECF subfamily)